MPKATCRACGFELPASEICAECGEDHRGWYARLKTVVPPPTLQAQEAEIARMQAEIGRQRHMLGEESARLAQHRAASASGQAVIDETRGRLARGLADLEAASDELAVAELGIVAVRSAKILDELRDAGHAAPTGMPAMRAIDPVSGVAVGEREAWSPLRALRPAWTPPAGGDVRFGGSALGRRVLFTEGPAVTVLDARDGRACARWDGALLDCWGDFALVATTDRLQVRSLVDGGCAVDLPIPGAERGHILPAGLLVWLGSGGLVLFGLDGRRLGEGRFSGNLVLSEDRRTLVAFPMVLGLPTLQPLVGLSRAPDPGATITAFTLDDRLLIGLGDRMVVWRLAEGGAPARLDVPAREAVRVDDALVVDGTVAFSLDRWPPRRLDAFDAARAVARLPLPRPPTRHRFSPSAREDRARGDPGDRAAFCHELARFAAGRVRAGGAREVACGILRDALVVEAEMLARLAGAHAARLAEHGSDAAAFTAVLDAARAPMMLLEGLPAGAGLDEASARRVRGLLATCAETVLTAVGERMSRRALAGEAVDGEIEASIALLAQVRGWVLERAPGLPWTGINELMARWKQVGRQAHELSDVAVATRALGRLAEASSAMRGAGARADGGALERLGRSIGDLAARSAADAEVEDLLAPEGVQARIAEGMERVRRELGKR